ESGAGTLTNASRAGRVLTTELDTQSRPVREEISGIVPVNYAYDGRGRLSTVVAGSGPDARITTFTYDARGLLESLTDPLTRLFRFSYDAADRLTERTLPDGRVTRYGYDAGCNRT